MRIRWAREARQDRMEIFQYIAGENRGAAIALDRRFEEAISSLSAFPQLGKEGVVPGTREFVPHEHYRVVYEVADDAVNILAIVHTARCWPR